MLANEAIDQLLKIPTRKKKPTLTWILSTILNILSVRLYCRWSIVLQNACIVIFKLATSDGFLILILLVAMLKTSLLSVQKLGNSEADLSGCSGRVHLMELHIWLIHRLLTYPTHNITFPPPFWNPWSTSGHLYIMLWFWCV